MHVGILVLTGTSVYEQGGGDPVTSQSLDTHGGNYIIYLYSIQQIKTVYMSTQIKLIF